MKECLPHLWRSDCWSVTPPVVVELRCRDQVRRRFWCHHLDPVEAAHTILFRILETSGLTMLAPGLADWTAVSSDGWHFGKFEELKEPCVSRA